MGHSRRRIVPIYIGWGTRNTTRAIFAEGFTTLDSWWARRPDSSGHGVGQYLKDGLTIDWKFQLDCPFRVMFDRHRSRILIHVVPFGI